MVTIDYFGIEIDGDQDPREYYSIMDQIRMDWEGLGINYELIEE